MSDKSWEPAKLDTLGMLNNFCFHVYAQKSLSHSHTLSLSLDMLNNFCFHVYDQESLFIAENCNACFGTSSAAASPYPVSLEFIELIPSKKLKMYFYSLHYLIAALKSKLGMNLFQSH